MRYTNFENKRQGTMTKGQMTMTKQKGSAGEHGMMSDDQWQCSVRRPGSRAAAVTLNKNE
jgi:hypothetical protein